MPVQFYLTAVNFVSMHVILGNILRGSVCLPKLKVYLLTYNKTRAPQARTGRRG
jgi:hypothetical protein